MSNLITEKFFSTDKAFGERVPAILAEICEITGFKPEKEIFRGFIYDADKVGSVIYAGNWRKRRVVLKIQGIKLDLEEADMIRGFEAQNQSEQIRVPEVLWHLEFDSKYGYGATILSEETGGRFFEMPFAKPGQMRAWAEFYQEYRQRAARKPWFNARIESSLLWVTERVKNWRQILESKRSLPLEAYAPYLLKFMDSIAIQRLRHHPMLFGHRHLTVDDVICQESQNGMRFVITANLFWDFMPRYYELAFNVWACLLSVKDTDFGLKPAMEYIDRWLDAYRELELVRQDRHFEQNMLTLLCERFLGSIMMDLGCGAKFLQPENAELRRHLVKLHQELFDHYADRLDQLPL